MNEAEFKAQASTLTNASEIDEQAPKVREMVLAALYHCEACGFLSTRRDAYTLLNGHLVCNNCNVEYGADPLVTRWIDELPNAGGIIGSLSEAGTKHRIL